MTSTCTSATPKSSTSHGGTPRDTYFELRGGGVVRGGYPIQRSCAAWNTYALHRVMQGWNAPDAAQAHDCGAAVAAVVQADSVPRQ